MNTYMCDVEMEVVAGGGHSNTTKLITKGYAIGKQKSMCDEQIVQNAVASTGGSVCLSANIK